MIGGLVTSTLFTLLALPTFYLFVQDIRDRWHVAATETHGNAPIPNHQSGVGVSTLSMTTTGTGALVACTLPSGSGPLPGIIVSRLVGSGDALGLIDATPNACGAAGWAWIPTAPSSIPIPSTTAAGRLNVGGGAAARGASQENRYRPARWRARSRRGRPTARHHKGSWLHSTRRCRLAVSSYRIRIAANTRPCKAIAASL